MADSVEVSTIETTDGTIGVIRDNAARQSIANIREGKETVGSVAWENVKGRPTKVSELENDKKYQTDENVSNTLNSTLYAGSSTHGGPATSADKLTTARTISLGGAAAGSGSFDGSENSTINVSSLDATKLTGIVPITNLPPSVVERMSVVKDDTERFALTTDSVQDGDVVKVQSTNLMYYVVDDTKLSTEAGYEVFKAGSAASVPWGGVTSKPSTFPPSTHTHTKSQITDFPSSMPNPNNLTMQIEGNDAAVYNGGTAQTFNVTKSALGLDKVNNTADADKSVKYASSAPWGGVTSKPSTFPPSTHTHTKSQITDLGVFGGASATAAGSAGLVPQPAAGDQDKYLSAKGTWESITGKISGTKVTSAKSADKLTTSRTLTIGNTGKSFDGSANVSWSLSEIGALPVNGNAGTVNGHTVNSDVPAGAVFTDHTYNFDGSEFTSGNHGIGTHDANAMTHNGTYYYSSNGPSGIGNSTNDGALYSQAYSETWVGQIAQDYRNGNLFTRGKNNGTWQPWKAVAYKSDIPTSLPASDVSAWAKASSKPSYSWNEITGKPSTFAPSSHTHTKDQVGLGNVVNLNQSKAIKSITRSGTTFTATALDGTTSTFTQQDTNTTYSVATSSADGLMSKSDKAKLDGIGTGSKSAKYTLTASKWSGSSAPYTYDLGSTYGNNSVIGFDSAVGSTAQLEAALSANIQGSSTTKIYAYGDKPTVDIPIVIIYQ